MSSGIEEPRPELEAMAKAIRTVRRLRKFTQAEVAQAADVSPATISKLEHATRGATDEVLEAVAGALGLSLDQLREIESAYADGDDEPDVEALLAKIDAPLEMAAPAEMPSRPSSSRPRRRATGTWSTDPSVQLLASYLETTTDPETLSYVVHRLLGTLLAVEPHTLSPDRLDLVERLIRSPRDPDVLAGLVELADGLAISDWNEAAKKRLRDLVEAVATSDELPRVATLPLGEKWWLLSNAVGWDGDQLWLDPLARAMRSGYSDRDLFIERLPEGRVVVDISNIPPANRDWGERDPERHRMRAVLPGDEDELAQAYRHTTLELEIDGTPLVVEPADPGITEGHFPTHHERIHVITAFNPRSRLLTELANQERNRMLRNTIEKFGWDYVECTGRSTRDEWSEEGFAVFDEDVGEVLTLAKENEQNAIYEWTPEHLAVVWTFDRPRIISGWRIESPDEA